MITVGLLHVESEDDRDGTERFRLRSLTSADVALGVLERPTLPRRYSYRYIVGML
jgi:hypothetical protein